MASKSPTESRTTAGKKSRTDPRAVSPQRRAANQAAARKSTGPQSPQGKRRAAFNSFVHGAFATQDHILHQALARAGCPPGELDRQRQALAADWQPASPQPQLLVDDLAWLYWQRDRTRLALLDSEARRLRDAGLEREQRRFQARYRPGAVTHSDYYPDGCARLDPSPDKFAVMRGLLDDLEARLDRNHWRPPTPAAEGYSGASLIGFLYGQTATTARGRKLGALWRACTREYAPDGYERRQDEEAKAAEVARASAQTTESGAAGETAPAARPRLIDKTPCFSKPRPGDPRPGQIRELIAAERQAIEEEERLFARTQELEEGAAAEAAAGGFDPLDEEWREIARQLQQLDRQIDAKIRLLLRLERRAEKRKAGEDGAAGATDDAVPLPTEAGEGSPGGAETPPPGAVEAPTAAPALFPGTKPSEPLESTTEAMGVGSRAGLAGDHLACRGLRTAPRSLGQAV
jgi:uncharacterized protein YjiS (DUF1127 family)